MNKNNRTYPFYLAKYKSVAMASGLLFVGLVQIGFFMLIDGNNILDALISMSWVSLALIVIPILSGINCFFYKPLLLEISNTSLYFSNWLELDSNFSITKIRNRSMLQLYSPRSSKKGTVLDLKMIQSYIFETDRLGNQILKIELTTKETKYFTLNLFKQKDIYNIKDRLKKVL